MNAMSPLEYYREQSPMSNPGELGRLFVDLPSDVPSMVKTVQQCLVHVFWAGAYGLELDEARKGEVGIRPVKHKLARLLESHAKALHRNLSILVQVNTGDEAQKSGVALADTESLIRAIIAETELRLIGLMTIPPYFTDAERSRPYFRILATIAADLARKGLFADNARVELSMGMSGDYPVAIEEGATIVRIGSALFGARNIQGVIA